MLVPQRSVLTALLALTAVVDRVLASALLDSDLDSFDSTDLFAQATSSFLNAFDLLNITIGGRLKAAVPFEAACFSTVQGKPITVDPSACAALQANYTDPTYRVNYFGAYMLVSSFVYCWNVQPDSASRPAAMGNMSIINWNGGVLT